MTIVTGTVTAATGNTLTVRVDRPARCSSCETADGCGVGPLLRLFVTKNSQYIDIKEKDSRNFAPGDRVGITLPGRQLAAAALMAYGLPLLGLFGGAAIAVAVAPAGGDVGALAGAAAGTAVSAVLLRLRGIARSVTGSLRVASWNP